MLWGSTEDSTGAVTPLSGWAGVQDTSIGTTYRQGRNYLEKPEAADADHIPLNNG